MDEWQIDAVVGASQKGISVPPGLSITALSQKALKVLESRKTPVASYFASYRRWLPIMESYEKGTPGYFATPSVNLIYALEASLKSIVAGPVSLEDRFRQHRDAAKRFRGEARQLGFETVATEDEACANGMTALYAPRRRAPRPHRRARQPRHHHRGRPPQGHQDQVHPVSLRQALVVVRLGSRH